MSFQDPGTHLRGSSGDQQGHYRSASGIEVPHHHRDSSVESVPSQLFGPKVVYVVEPKGGSDSSDADITSSEDEEMRFQFHRGPDVPAEYWHIQKLVKYVKAGDETATNVALCLLGDHDLTLEINQTAIRDIGGLEVLVNLLEVEDHKCKSGALKVLNEISANARIRQNLVDLGIVPLLVNLLSAQARDLQVLAAETIAKVAKVRRARRFVRKTGGLPVLVDLMDVNQKALDTPREELGESFNEQVDLARACARAVWSLAMSDKNVEHLRRVGLVWQLVRYVQAVHYDVVVPTLGALAECARAPKIQLAIETEDVVEDLVEYLGENDRDMVRHTALTIFKCAESEEVREMVREAGGLDHLMRLCRDKGAMEDKRLMAAVTGALWKCAKTPANVRRLDQLRAMEVLVPLLLEEDEDVLAHCAGAIGELCYNPDNFDNLRMAKGLAPLVNVLNGTYEPMLANACIALAKCAGNSDCMKEMEQLDAVRFIWSLLKNPDEKVQAEAAWALCPCIRYGYDSGEMVRSFVGGLELVVDLLLSKDDYVLAAVCAAIAEIALDTENLAVITDLGVVPLLADLVTTHDPLLRCHLADAIGNCCNWGTNGNEFGRLGVIKSLVKYVHADDEKLMKTTAHAIHQLTTDPYNCIELHSEGVVPFLLQQIASPDQKVQNAAAGALNNMRKLVLAAEKFKFSQ